ncbi:MAG: hypothetical protein AB8B71_08615 [Paracoccaceae bacterium]
MFEKWAEFLRNENGAVTVDWVVLSAAIVGLGVAVATAFTSGAINLSDEIWAYVDGLGLY